MSYMAAFRVTFEAIEDACPLRVGGQIDSSKAAEFRKHLRNARLEGHTTLVDLANVSFIDSAGLRASKRDLAAPRQEKPSSPPG